MRLSIVSYYNTIPLVYGLERFMPPGVLTIEKDEPNVCSAKLFSGAVDVGLVPVGSLVGRDDYHIISNFCIGAEGKVSTVGLFSQCDISQLTGVFLDPHSQTSNLLVKVLARHSWGIEPRWLAPETGYEAKITNTTGGVIIGNRVFDNLGRFDKVTDLAESWCSFAGLPFVFACFVSRKTLDDDFCQEFNRSISRGIENMSEAIASTHTRFSFDIYQYLTENIKYNLDGSKREAMRVFLDYCSSLSL